MTMTTAHPSRLARTLGVSLIAASAFVGLGAGTAAADTAAAVPHSAPCTINPSPRINEIHIDQRDTELHVMNLINQYRVANGVPALRAERNLQRAAQWASVDSYFLGYSPSSHVDSHGRGIGPRVQACGYTNARLVGEINFWGYGGASYAGPEAALRFWKNSPGHNYWLLNRNVTSIGVGLAYDGDDRHRQHWTVNFGTR